MVVYIALAAGYLVWVITLIFVTWGVYYIFWEGSFKTIVKQLNSEVSFKL